MNLSEGLCEQMRKGPFSEPIESLEEFQKAVKKGLEKAEQLRLKNLKRF